MKRREFLALVGGATLAPLVARAQQPMPLVGFLNGGVSSTGVDSTAAFRKGLSEAGLVEGRNVAVEYHWFGGEYDRVPAVIADLIRRRVAVIATPGFPPGALAAESSHHDDPDRVWRRRRPGQAWFGRKPGAAGRQRHRHQFFRPRACHQAARADARACAESCPHRGGGQSRQCGSSRSHDQGSARGCAYSRDANPSFQRQHYRRRSMPPLPAIARERADALAYWRRSGSCIAAARQFARWRRATDCRRWLPDRASLPWPAA